MADGRRRIWREGFREVYLPDALTWKNSRMQRRAGVGSRSFPSGAYPRTHAVVRVRPHHMPEKVLQDAVNQVAR